MKTFEECKEDFAKLNTYKSWDDLMAKSKDKSESLKDSYWEGASKIYAKNLIYKSNDKIESIAFERSVDYKPWDEDLHFRDYYRQGFIDGYKENNKMYSVDDLKRAWEDGNAFEDDANGGEGGTFTGSETFEEYLTSIKP